MPAPWGDSQSSRDGGRALQRAGLLHLAQLLEELAGRGELTIVDPDLAAQHFVWLVLGLPLDRGMFDVDATAPTAERLDHIADAGVRVFIAAYGR